ncbi:chemotaxis protein CheW [Methylomonas sp. MgM2]
MNQEKSIKQIVHQRLALDVYLRTLLDEVPEADADEPNGHGQPVAGPALDNDFLLSAPKPVQEDLSILELPQTALAPAENPSKLHVPSVMPDWALTEFHALFFKVGHLILATPLVELSRTIKNDRKPGKMPGQPSWFMGLLNEHDSRIGVLDTGQLLFGKHRGSQRDLDKQPFKSILITQDKRWGLACDEVLSVGKLSPEKVRWRTNRQKRPWLIGTVIEELTAIVDLQELVPHRRIRT